MKNNYHLFLKLIILLTMLCFTNYSNANPATQFEMPFGLTLAPNTRIVDVAQYNVGTIKEANGRLATKKTAREVVSFYERELQAKGFIIASKTDTAKRVSIVAKRGKGDFFSLSDYGDDFGLEPGETELRIIIRYAPVNAPVAP